MKIRKFVLIVCLLLLTLLIVIVMFISAYLSNEHQFNVYDGLVAVTELNLGNKYADLPGERVLIKSKDWDGNFQNAFFDSWEAMDTPVPSGKGLKDGIKYIYYMDKTVTSSYTIVVLLKEPYPDN